MKKKYFFTMLVFALCFLGQHHSFGQNECGKIWVEDQTLYTVYPMLGVAAYDISNPTNPVEQGFIELVGVVDIAVRGSFIFANQFEDLLCIKVDWEKNSYEEWAKEENVFPNRREQVALALRMVQMSNLDDVRKPNFISYLKEQRGLGAISNSVQGSMSCLALKGDYVYAVNASDLMTFNADIMDESNLLEESNRDSRVDGQQDVLETIYIDGNGLYVGSNTGMYTYNIKEEHRAAPAFDWKYEHQRSCDPVFVKGNLAYVTLRGGRDRCGDINCLDIIDIPNKKLLKRHNMRNPHGLSLTDDGTLLICEGDTPQTKGGLKILNANRRGEVTLIEELKGFHAYDVIYSPDDISIVSTGDGWRLYNLRNKQKEKSLSFIPLKR